jgi:hypothetical protein
MRDSSFADGQFGERCRALPLGRLPLPLARVRAPAFGAKKIRTNPLKSRNFGSGKQQKAATACDAWAKFPANREFFAI